ERHLADLANTLAKRGHEVFAALVPGSPLRQELSAVSPANVIEAPMRNALNLRSAMLLWRFIREMVIEIVHSHVARDYPLAACFVSHELNSQVDAAADRTRHCGFASGGAGVAGAIDLRSSQDYFDS